MKVKNILVPITDVNKLKIVLPDMVEWLRKLRGKVGVNLLYVAEAHGLDAATPTLEEIRVKKAQLRELAKQFEAQGMNAHYKVKLGDLVEDVTQEARDSSAFSILMCADERSRLPKMVNRDVVERIIGRSPCPVVVFKPKLMKFTDRSMALLARFKRLTPRAGTEKA